jgi:hypothetical protein
MYCLGDLEVDGRMILKSALNKEDVIMGIGSYSSLRTPTSREWRGEAVVNPIMKLWGRKKRRNF